MKMLKWKKAVRPILVSVGLVLVGCSSLDDQKGRENGQDGLPSALSAARTEAAASQTRSFPTGNPPPPERPFSERMPTLPAAAERYSAPATPSGIAPATDARSASLNFAQVPIGEFVRAVYAQILKRTVVVDDKVQSSRDLVTIRTPSDLTPLEIERLTRGLLADYGIAVQDVDGVVKVTADPSAATALPEIRRGASKAETPASLRHVYQLVPLEAVRNTDVAGWIKTLFGDRVELREDAGRNSVLLSGTPDAVTAAYQAVRMLDQPVMQGRDSLRINPKYWSAKELADDLSDVLGAEGYAIPPANASPRSGGIRYPVILIPVEQINAILVFAANDTVLTHVREWAYRLDVPNTSTGDAPELVQYIVRNTTAEEVGKFLEQLLSSSSVRASSARGKADTSSDSQKGGGRAADSEATGLKTGSQVVVDTGTNSLSFRVAPEERDAILALLRSIDKPPRSALLDVTIAEIRLDDQTDLGVEWLLQEASIGSVTKSAVLGTSGFTLSWLNSQNDVRLTISTLASSDHATILSTPSIMARNGEEAEIQVGQEVPIVTSQQSSLASSGDANSTGVLQTIQYKDTGVILRVKPIIHSNNMVDVEVEQEVSSAQQTVTGVEASPTFSTRRMKTRLSLRHGSTVLLGGLISSEQSSTDTGVPVVKDVPVLGKLFSRSIKRQQRKELVMLITPYILSDQEEYDAVLESFMQRMPMWNRHNSGAPAGDAERGRGR